MSKQIAVRLPDESGPGPGRASRLRGRREPGWLMRPIHVAQLDKARPVLQICRLFDHQEHALVRAIHAAFDLD